jgi:hypothetical protein
VIRSFCFLLSRGPIAACDDWNILSLERDCKQNLSGERKYFMTRIRRYAIPRKSKKGKTKWFARIVWTLPGGY